MMMFAIGMVMFVIGWNVFVAFGRRTVFHNLRVADYIAVALCFPGAALMLASLAILSWRYMP